MVAVAVLINALFTWVFTKKHTQDLTFVTALAGGCMANVYPCTAFVAAFILGMFAPGIATLVLMVSMMIWCTIMTINVQRLLAGAEDDKRVWIAFVYTLICGAITAVSGIVVLSSMIAAAVDSISDSLGMFLY
jgi:hypothetical protein